MKIHYSRDGMSIKPETELEKIHMVVNVLGLEKELCEINPATGEINLRFKMLYEKLQESRSKHE